MRILILGAGGIGGYFGARLAAAGVDVRFLVRPARADALRAHGLVLRSPLGDLTMPAPIVTEAAADADAVVVACKAFDLDSAIAAIAPAVGPRTLVLPLLNGIRHLDALDAAFGAPRVLGGVAMIGVTLGPQGEIMHLNRGQGLVLGARQAAQSDGAAALHAELSRASFGPVLSPAIMHAMWEKFCLITTFGAMACLMRAPVGAIVAAEEGAALMRETYDECAAVAAAAGHPPSDKHRAGTLAMLTEPGSKATSSMARDLAAGLRTEHEHLVGDMLARARAAGLAAPLLRVALAHLQAAAAQRAA